MADSDVQAGASFDELLEHLDDLAQLVANEGFTGFSSALAVLLYRASRDRETFGARLIPSPSAPSPSLRKTT